MARRYLEAKTLLRPISLARVKDARILDGISASKLEKTLSGLQFNSACRHGKRLFLNLKEDLWLTLHLGLTGDLIYFPNPEDEPDHTRLLISFRDGCYLAYDDSRMFGQVGLTDNPQSFLEEKKIGPDALQLTLPKFMEIMGGRRGRIKPTLLNQRHIAGLGNLYTDEALFQAGISPQAGVPGPESLQALFSSIQDVLKTAIACEAKMEVLPDYYLLPHRYPGGKCPRDGHTLSRAKIGGRTSYYCSWHQR